MSYIVSPNMNLSIPTVGVEPGPTYAQDINNSLTAIDSHNHTPGSGVQITPAGLDLNSDVDMQNNNIISIRSLRLQDQGAALALPTDLGCLYEVGADLYYNDGLGNQIRMTQSGGVAGTPGSIANLVPPASASYVSGSSTFVFQSNTLTPGNLDGASLVLRNLVPSSFGMTIAPPNSMAADSTITLPVLPSVSSQMLIDNTGAITTTPVLPPYTPSGAAIPFLGSIIPPGFLQCNGAAVSRTTYAALFAVIGTAYGPGDGSTTFNLPIGPPISFESALAPYPSYVVANWKMDGTTTEPNSVTPGSFNLSVTGSVPSAAGKINLARGPFASSNYLSWPSGGSDTTVFDQTFFLAEFWFKGTDSGEAFIIGKTSGGNGWHIRIYSGGTVSLNLIGATSLDSPAGYNDGLWHYAVVGQIAAGAGNCRIYIDNTNVASTAGVSGFTKVTTDLFVGISYANTLAYNGLIDDMAFWNTVPGTWAAVESIISQRWNGGAGAPYAGTVAGMYIVKT